MRPRLNYDFSTLLETYSRMLGSRNCTSRDTATIKRELNKFFTDSKCRDVIYTDNTDKMFFGMRVISHLNADKIYDYLMDNKPVRISEYMIEIDSHLLSPMLNMTARELLAITLHEVGHLVNDAEPFENARNAIDMYMTQNKEALKMSDSIHYKEILAFGLKDYLSKNKSIFYTSADHEVLADEFVRSFGLGDALENAIGKITRNNAKLYEESENSKLMTLYWTLQLYRHVATRRIGAIKTLTRAKKLTGSKIEQAEIEGVIRRINRIDDSALLESNVVSERIQSRMRKMKRENMRDLRDDFYELSMRIRNVEDENDALYLMRQINTRISLIDDYINSDVFDDDKEKKAWMDSLDKFMKAREDLAKTVTYKNKSFGVFVAYPDIKENNY